MAQHYHDPDLLKGYAELGESRDWSHETTAAHLDGIDRSLAAAYREEYGVKGKPADRQAPPTDTTDASGAPAAPVGSGAEGDGKPDGDGDGHADGATQEPADGAKSAARSRSQAKPRKPRTRRSAASSSSSEG